MSNSASRTKKSTLNAVTGFAAYFFIAILGFVVRSIFIRYLNVELLGVNGLFSSILQIFSLAELGFATAVGVALYRPLQEKDERKTAALMNLYAKIYRVIGFAVLGAGLIILLFLQYFIKDFESVTIALNDLRLYFFLTLLSSVASYFVAYKKTLLISDQRKFVVNINNFAWNLLGKAIQIVALVLFKNFILYLSINIVFIYVENIVASVIVGKSYGFLKQYKKEKLLKQEKKELFANIGALAVAKFSSVFTTGIVSIVISTMIGIEVLGKYSNYFLVVSTLLAVLVVVYEAVTAGVGNFSVTESREKQRELFKKLYFIFAFFAILGLVGFFTQLDSFIAVWLNEDMLLPKSVAIALAFHVFLYGLRTVHWILYDAYGLYKHYFYRSFFEVAVFCSLAFFGAKFFGAAGVVAAQIIAVLTTQFWVEAVVVCKFGLQVKAPFYLVNITKYLLIAAIALALSVVVCYFIPLTGFLGFIVETVSVILLVALVYIACTFWTAEFKYYAGLFRRLFKRKSKTRETNDLSTNDIAEDD